MAEDVLEQLKRLGVKSGQWTQLGAKSVPMPRASEIVNALQQLKGVLEGQVEADRRKLVELQAQLGQIKRGGGR